MSEILIALAALAAGVLLGLFLRRPRPRSTPPAPRSPLSRSTHRELLNAADDLEYALNTVRNFGPLCASELLNVDLPAKLDRLAAGAPPVLFAELRRRTEQIALHPFPEQRELVSAVRSDEQPSPLSAVWLLIREASGSGAAQHLAAGRAKSCLDELRLELARNAPDDEPVLV
ncbi:MAG TPA: hypothetical protein VNO31_32550 [Umezawaea sp.]|nr:hypothetical protein [Umezawaea sp.]